MTPSPSRNRRVLKGCLALTVFAVAVPLIVLVVLVIFLRAEPPGITNGVGLTIRLPRQGSRLDMNRVQRVIVQTSRAETVDRLELWVDGRLVGALRRPAEPDSLPPIVQFAWRPAAAGAHILVARGYDSGGHPGRSQPVVVDVAPSEEQALVYLRAQLASGQSLESLAESSGVDLQALREANPGMPASPAPGEEIRVPIPRGDLPPGFHGDDPESPPDALPAPAPESAPGLPQAIELTAEARDGCGVRFQWSGGEGAEAFDLLRFGPGDVDFRSVLEVDGETRQAEGAVPDAGRFLYLVSGSNRNGSTESNLTVVEIAPDECEVYLVPPDDPAGQAWQFEGIELLTPSTFQRLYCYVGSGGGRYDRLPASEDDFLTSPDGQVWDLFSAAGGINRIVFHWRPERPEPLRMECWGWQGETLSLLGNVDFQPDGVPGLRDLVAQGFRMRADLQPLEGFPPLVPLSHEDPSVPPPYELDLPAGAIDCASHITWGSGAEFEAGERRFMGWACAELTDDILQWEWQASLDTERDDLTGFRIYLNRDYGESPRDDDHTLSTWEVLGEIGSAVQVFPIPRPTCGQTFGFKAQAFIIGREFVNRAEFGAPDIEVVATERVSAPSETYPLVAGPCPAPSVLVEITLDTLTIGRTHDECFDIDLQCDDVSLQGYGEGTWWRVDTDGEPHEVASMMFWNERSRCISACTLSGPEGTVRDHDTTLLALQDLSLCTPETGCTGMGRDNNHFQVWIEDGDAVVFDFALWDHDVGGDDLFCGTTDDPAFLQAYIDGPGFRNSQFRIGPFDWETWSDFDHRHADNPWNNDDFGGQLDHAECSLDIVVTAIEVEGAP